MVIQLCFIGIDAKVAGKDAFHIILLGAGAIEALLVNAFLNAVERRERLLIGFVSHPYGKQELPRRRHLHLNFIQKHLVTFQQFSDQRVGFILQTCIQIQLVVIEVLPRIQADDLDIRLYGQKLHQLLDLLPYTDSAQHRDVGRFYEEIHDFSVPIRLDTVAGKTLDSKHGLRGKITFLHRLLPPSTQNTADSTGNTLRRSEYSPAHRHPPIGR